MAAPLFRLLGTTFKRFNADRCFNHSIVISYFTLMCAVPLVALLAFATTKILGSSELAIRSLNIFTEDFFAKFDPSFFTKLSGIAKKIANLGWFGLLGSFIGGSFLFSNLINAINAIFKAKTQKSFFYNRLMEYIIMFIIGVIMFFSLSITTVWTALHRAITASAFFRDNLNPDIMGLVDNFFIQYLIPFMLGFLVLFVIYKYIPETKVHTRPAVIAAVVGSVLWEIFKRIFVFYIANFSAVGIVLSKLLQGTLTSIIFFLLWISFSLAILLWGAELAAVLNERIPGNKAEAA
ncbi:MAG: YihY/virulence factor BrkB family protein [Candidatus Aminicenantes bacterium]|nr:YihY/virulence factor BrkB family protein [Candidatus Aminicenantes bacterium]